MQATLDLTHAHFGCHLDRLSRLGRLLARPAGASRRAARKEKVRDMPASEMITLLLRKWRDGDQAAMDELMPLVYDELRGLARRELGRDRPRNSLQPTDLVHDAYARLVGLELSWQDRLHFYRMAARTMRRVLVDQARARLAEKRGGDAVMVSFDEAGGLGQQPASNILDLSDALDRLGEMDERMGQAVELFYFGGLSYAEVAEALDISRATVDRDLRFARAWLRKALDPQTEAGGADGT